MVVQKTEKELRQRKMMALLPVIIVPMLALAFYALGGGRGGVAKSATSTGKGMNMALPEARFDPKKKGMDKLGAYNQADRDSAKMLERRRADPYYGRPLSDTGNRKGWLTARSGMDTGWRRALVPGRSAVVGGPGHGNETDAQADELMAKLDRLKAVLQHQEGQTKGLPGSVTMPKGELSGSRSMALPSVEPGATRPVTYGGEPGAMRPVIGGGDPDLDKLNTMLDKVLKIQHPEQGGRDTVPVSARSLGKEVGIISPVPVGRVGVDTGQVLGVSNIPDPGGRVGMEDDGLGSGFMDIDGTPLGDSAENSVVAVVSRDQTLVSGASVEMRLEQNALVGGRTIPRGTPLWGKASLSGERLLLAVSSVRLGNEVLPVNLEVFDMDGMAGVRVEGSINRDAAKASADEVVGSMGVTSLDPSLAGQATAAGIQAARSLISRKVRLVRVTLKAGYRVLLKNSKSFNR